jgi:DNA replication and repair protein RecF
LGLARIVWLVPAMDRLWIEGAEGRRRFLDRMTLSFRARPCRGVLAYEKAMRERNRLLKDEVRDPAGTRAGGADGRGRRGDHGQPARGALDRVCSGAGRGRHGLSRAPTWVGPRATPVGDGSGLAEALRQAARATWRRGAR